MSHGTHLNESCLAVGRAPLLVCIIKKKPWYMGPRGERSKDSQEQRERERKRERERVIHKYKQSERDTERGYIPVHGSTSDVCVARFRKDET